MTERDIFLAALEITDPAAREAYLAEACGADAALRRRVEDLLAVAGSASFMAPLAAGLGRPDPGRTAGPAAGPADVPAGTVLAGRYVLGDQIGRGGMGTVYRADQVAPVKRPVAVKLVNPGADSQAVLARFEAERQALAVMDHPAIAKVFDAGATPDGRPFFVMELVGGVPLTEYCDARRLAVPDRLALFREVCGAVQHAHQKGVIHRDLKPSNILVAEADGRPAPKVIDFGIAKATGGAGPADGTLFTAPGAVLGTPLYMAPEQAGGAPDVDTRADVYALGAVLYELLTGSTPIARDTLKQAALGELLRVIREDDPPPPSSRLSTAGGAPSAAAVRGVEPARLGRLVRGDLDWIVMKALDKDRGRRYESAAAFAADVDRFLHHEPVAAGPPSAAYRVRKFVRRNRVAVTAAGLVLTALVAGVVGTSLGLVEARHQRDAAGSARDAEADQRRRAEAAEADARRQAADALDQLALSRAVRDFLENDLLGQAGSTAQADRKHEPNPKLTVREALDRAAAAAGDRFKGRPAVEVSLRGTMGQAYREVGAPDAAVEQFRRAADLSASVHGPDHRTTLTAQSNLGDALRLAGRAAEAAPLLEAVVAAFDRSVGPDDPDALAARHHLGAAYRDLGRPADAVPLFERALAGKRRVAGPDHPSTLATLDNLSAALHDAGRRADAVARAEEALAAKRRVLPPDHPSLLAALSNLAASYAGLGRWTDAAPLLEEALPGQRRVLGSDHPDTLVTLDNLAATYLYVDRLADAVRLHREALDAHERVVGADHPDTVLARHNLAYALRAGGRLAEAVPLHEEVARAVERRKYQIGTAGVLIGQAADALEEAGRSADAGGWRRKWAAVVRERAGPGSAAYAAELAAVGLNLVRQRKWADAEPVWRECLAVREATQPDAWFTFNTRSQLGGSLLGQGKADEAGPHLLAGYEGLRARAGAIPPAARPARLAEAADRLVEWSVAVGQPEEVARWRSERARYPFVAPPPRPAAR